MKACFEVLTNSEYRENAKSFQELLAKYNGPLLGADLIEQFASEEKQKPFRKWDAPGISP